MLGTYLHNVTYVVFEIASRRVVMLLEIKRTPILVVGHAGEKGFLIALVDLTIHCHAVHFTTRFAAFAAPRPEVSPELIQLLFSGTFCIGAIDGLFGRGGSGDGGGGSSVEIMSRSHDIGADAFDGLA